MSTTTIVQITADPIDLADAAELGDTAAQVQNIGPRPCYYFCGGDEAPEALQGHVLNDGRVHELTAGEDAIWVWADAPGSTVAVTV